MTSHEATVYIEHLTCREVLDLIDQKLATGDVEAHKLWDVLTALRGPDSGLDELKDATTAVIRGAAFPLLYGKGGVNLGIVMKKRGYVVLGPIQDHFARHIMRAIRALGLKEGDWEEGLKK